jgi:signal transduction histidine kinase
MSREVRVLIVDDDPVDLELTRRLLAGAARMRFTIDTAEHLATAIELLRARAYDVLLLDLNLAPSRGLETLDAVRGEDSELPPIVVLSGLADEETALRSLDRGAQDYLVKGNFTSDTLANSIRYAMQRQQLLQEITHTKELLEKKNQRLAELYETAHRFVDTVSHEFRTPLTVIKEYTSLVRDGLASSGEEQRRFLDVVIDRADDLNNMVDDMLDVSRLEAGLLGAWRKNCRVAAIVEELRPALERKAAMKGIELAIDLDPALAEVYCDPEKVSRVIINLTVNAVKFCQEGGHVRLWATPCADAPGVTIGITDDGRGIDRDSLARIFERFTQLDPTSRGSCKGFGLGLNIAKELVDLSFGRMSVESQVGRGSTFSFSLPPTDPPEVMRRYVERLRQLSDAPAAISILVARVDEAVGGDEADDVDAYLHSLLRRNDIVFRVEDHAWLVVLATSAVELSKFHDKARLALAEVNRNRIRGPLPDVRMETAGTWRIPGDCEELFRQLREWVEAPGAVHA